MCAVGIPEINILDEGYFFEDIAGLVTYTQTTIDNRECECVAVLKKQHRRHWEQFVDFASDLRELGTVVIASIQPECQEDVGLDDGVIHLRLAGIEKPSVYICARQVLASELEKRVNRNPFRRQCPIAIQFPL